MIQVDRLTKIYPRKIKSNNLSKDRLIALDSLCLEAYGNVYREYMNRTPRWVGIQKSGKK